MDRQRVEHTVISIESEMGFRSASEKLTEVLVERQMEGWALVAQSHTVGNYPHNHSVTIVATLTRPVGEGQ